jgi:asparagine synthase (glutamine-hydrolysing)
MCGIAGIFRFNDETVSGRELSLLLDALNHRGPDHAGMVFYRRNEHSPRLVAGNYSLGHTRLSIIDLSPQGNQPMFNEDQTLVLVFNGEIYNFKELRNSLIEQGHRFRSGSDAEVLLHLYEEKGKYCVKLLEGMFSFALLDLKNQKLFLARDRLGKKPFKFYHDEKQFVFASEVNALIKAKGISREIDTEAIEAYTTYRYVPEPFTGIKNIHKLPPASFMTVDLKSGVAKLEHYWDPALHTITPYTMEEAAKAFIENFTESVNQRLVADVPLGILLSGGIDSSSIVAVTSGLIRAPLKTFTFGFKDKKFDESSYARQVAAQFGTDHTEIDATEEIAQDLDKIIMAYDEPFADPSAIPTWYIAREAAKHVKVILVGDGGDELFGGYKRYNIQARSSWLTYLTPGIRKAFMERAQSIPFSLDKKSLKGKLRRLLQTAGSTYAQGYLMRMNNLDPLVRAQLFCKEWKLKNPESLIDLLYTNAPGNTPIEKIMALDMVTYLPGDILKKSDLSTMAHGLEGRHPFLSNELIDLAFTLPGSLKLAGGGKAVIKQAMARNLPANILNRKKMGFSPPMKDWIKNELKERVEFALISEESPLIRGNAFNEKLLKEMLDGHLSGRSNFSDQIWMLLSLSVWMEGLKLEFSFNKSVEKK